MIITISLVPYKDRSHTSLPRTLLRIMRLNGLSEMRSRYLTASACASTSSAVDQYEAQRVAKESTKREASRSRPPTYRTTDCMRAKPCTVSKISLPISDHPFKALSHASATKTASAFQVYPSDPDRTTSTRQIRHAVVTALSHLFRDRFSPWTMTR